MSQAHDAPLTFDDVRADVAEILRESVDDIGVEDNLVDWGLDSIRLMLLRQRWIDRGADVPFAQLAERPQLTHWWTLLQAAK
jgi:bifunctional isochorismate lyase/aryl carrier protein